MGSRAITREQRNQVTPMTDEARSVLRRYEVDLRLVPTVDNQGEQCTFCSLEGQAVDCNTYLRTFDGEDLCVDHCRACWHYVVDGHFDTDPAVSVITESIQGGGAHDPF